MQQDATYPGQPRDEVTQQVIYKHFISIAPILLALILVVIAILAIFTIYSTNHFYFEQYLSQPIIGVIGFLMIGFIIFLTLATIWIWRRNRIIITNHHIVDIDQIGLFGRSVSTLRLEEIQDISAKVNGPLQNIMGYGTIIIQTAGERENFVFDFVPNPYDLERDILEARKNKHHSKK